MSNEVKPKTWQRTKTPGLLRHRGGRYYGRFSSGGKTKFVPLETDLLEIARTRFAEHKARNERGRRAAANTKSGISRMRDLLTLYRQRVKDRADIEEPTRKVYLENIDFIEKTWPGFSDLRPDEITRSAVEKWRDHVLKVGTGFKPPGATGESTKVAGRSAGRFNKAVDALRKMIDMAVESGALHGNVLTARGIKAKDKPRKPQLPDSLILHEVYAEIERGGGRGGWGLEAADFCRFLNVTGCRKSEAAGVRVQHIDMPHGIIRVTGTKSEAADREVPMCKAARELIEKILTRRRKAVAELIGDQPLDADLPLLAVKEAQKSLDRACAKVGVPRLTHHDLRDAFATMCIEAGVDIPTVAAWLGHADGGALLMRVYAHHRRAHSVIQMAKVNF